MEFVKTLKSFGKVMEFVTMELKKLITLNFIEHREPIK